MVTVPHTPDFHYDKCRRHHIDQDRRYGKRHQYFFFFNAPGCISVPLFLCKKDGQFVAFRHVLILPFMLFSENDANQLLVQHQRPVPGIQDHALDAVCGQRHAKQLLDICEKRRHHTAASLQFFFEAGER